MVLDNTAIADPAQAGGVGPDNLQVSLLISTILCFSAYFCAALQSEIFFFTAPECGGYDARWQSTKCFTIVVQHQGFVSASLGLVLLPHFFICAQSKFLSLLGSNCFHCFCCAPSIDTSFMYMIAGLCMLKLYQTRHPDINASAYSAYASFAVVISLAVLGVVWLLLTYVLL